MAVYGARPEGVQIKVNGRDYSADDNWRNLPKGGTVRNHRGRVITRWLDGTEMWVESFPKHLNVYVKLAPERSGQVRGLLGNYNDNPDDELITRDGKQITLSGKKDELYWVQLYETFGESWRISEAESLFDYVQGKNYAAFQIRSFPIKSFTVIDLSDDDRKKAQAVCTSSGIRTQPLLDDCILDVGVTKDAEFARSALAVSNSRHRENTGHSLEAETKSFTVEIDKPGSYPIENFEALAGQKMFFRALASGGLKWSEWKLEDSEGKIIFTQYFDPGAMQPGEHVLPKTGNYRSTLTTSGSETGTLEVTRNLVPDPQIFDISLPARISPDVPAKGAGRIELPGSKDTFRFAANSGDMLALSVLKRITAYISRSGN